MPGAGEGEMCGGIAGFACAPGLWCKGMDPRVADAAGTCQEENYCETATVDGDCAGLMHPASPGNWGCDERVCTWVARSDVHLVSFDELRDNPVTYADGRVVQVTWSVDAQDADGSVSEVLGEAPVVSPPMGDGGDFVILNGIQCNGYDCDFDRGTWVTATGRMGLLQGGHLLMQVLRADEANSCSLADTTCSEGMHCQIGIGCPAEGSCGINPPGMCLEE